MTAEMPALSRIVPIRRWKSVFESYGQEFVILAALVVLFVGVGLYNPRFISTNNLTSMFVGNAYIAIAAIGMSMVIISGNIDVSVGSLIGRARHDLRHHGGRRLSDLPVLAGAGADRHGDQCARRRAGRLCEDPLDRGDARDAVDPQRAGSSASPAAPWISGMPPAFMIAQFRLFGLPSSVYFMVVLTVLAALWMKYSVFGRTIYAIGGNPEAARVSGIRIQPSIVAVFTIHGMFAGIAAVLFATQLQVIQSTVPPNLELTVITASVVGGVSILGGTGTVIGSTLAAILFAAIGSSLVFLNVSAYWLRAVQGLMILATVLADMARRRRI